MAHAAATATCIKTYELKQYKQLSIVKCILRQKWSDSKGLRSKWFLMILSSWLFQSTINQSNYIPLSISGSHSFAVNCKFDMINDKIFRRFFPIWNGLVNEFCFSALNWVINHINLEIIEFKISSKIQITSKTIITKMDKLIRNNDSRIETTISKYEPAVFVCFSCLIWNV